MENIYQLIEIANKALHRGDLVKAENYYRQVLILNPDNSETLNTLGIICCKQGKLEEAINFISKAINNEPKNHILYSNLGEMLRSEGRLQEAEDIFHKAIKLRPDFAGAKYNLANTLKTQGKYIEAIKYYQQAIQIFPEDFQAWSNLGNACMELGGYQASINSYQKALRINPNLYDVHYNLSRALKELNRWQEAIHHNQQSIRLNPDFAKGHRYLGIIYETQSKIDKAIQCYQNLLKLEPDNIGLKLHIDTLSPLINLSNYEIDKYRENLLKTIDKYIQLYIKIDLRKIYENIHPPLTLIYQGRDDRYLREKYAEIFKNTFTPFSPQISKGKSHIGFVVTQGHEGIFIKCLKGIINNFSGEDFDITIICDPLNDFKKIKPELTNHDDKLLGLPKYFDEMVEAIRNANCDILYYWEVGTDTTNYFLPFFKLAPIQCTGWGWPITTGIPQMDYFISSELLETDESDKLYSETLVRLKSLPPYYYRPSIPKELKPREYFGFSDSEHIYFCMQNLRKVHPDFDKIIGDILRKDPKGVVVFTEDQHGNITSMLKNRLQKPQADVMSRIKFLKRISSDSDYLNFLALTDVALDTLHCVGSNTTYEALAVGVPIVTLPGSSIRGRYTYGTYKKMDIDDCIAKDEEDYINIALKIANDSQYRKQLSNRILESCHVLFEDISAVNELTDFFKTVIANHEVSK